jgi:hypothetical protein
MLLELRHEMERFKRGAGPGDLPVENLVFCLLHIKQRVVQRFIRLLVSEVLDPKRGLTAAERDALLRRAEAAISCGLGRLDRSPFVFKRISATKVKDLTCPIYRLMDVFNLQGQNLIDICCDDSDEERHVQIRQFYDVLKQLIHCLNSPWNTEHNTKEVACLSHLYYARGVAIWGEAFVHNYSHILGAGHVTELLEMGYNIKKLEGQSTENIVSLLKKLYHHKTAHGGVKQKKGAPKGTMVATGLCDAIFMIKLRRMAARAGRFRELLGLVRGSDDFQQVIRMGIDFVTDDDDDSEFEDPGSESDDDKCADNDTDVSDDDDDGAYQNLLAAIGTAGGRTTRRTPAEGVKQRRREGTRRRNSAPT